ncbi:MAG TPA: alpha/beta hydrolase [Candidatus Aquilonibacter sp.]|nr:alpha/beta hydrolase [Candidatus Aquilonibacter sp.]
MSMVQRAAAFICFGIITGGLAAISGIAQNAPVSAASGIDPGLNIRTVELWPGGAPGQRGDAPSDVPAVSVFAPRKGHAGTTAVVIAPGGAYVELAADLEGREVADWFAARGITAFVLRYRLGAKYQYPIPLEDAQRAVRYVRANAAKYGIDPEKIGIMGFSAGGHLAAMESVSPETANANATDPVDRASSKPDFVVLGYPWLNAMEPNTQGLITYCSTRATVKTVPEDMCKEFETKYDPVRYVTSATPPTFIYGTSDDETVDVQAEIDYFAALRAAKVSAEFHCFAHGAHGSGLGSGDPALDLWPTLLDAWLRGQGFLGKVK